MSAAKVGVVARIGLLRSVSNSALGCAGRASGTGQGIGWVLTDRARYGSGAWFRPGGDAFL